MLGLKFFSSERRTIVQFLPKPPLILWEGPLAWCGAAGQVQIIPGAALAAAKEGCLNSTTNVVIFTTNYNKVLQPNVAWLGDGTVLVLMETPGTVRVCAVGPIGCVATLSASLPSGGLSSVCLSVY